MKKKFKLQEGGASISQGSNEVIIVGKGVNAYLWIGGKVCYGTISGMKTLESLAASIYRALGHEPIWMARERKKSNKKKVGT